VGLRAGPDTEARGKIFATAGEITPVVQIARFLWIIYRAVISENFLSCTPIPVKINITCPEYIYFARSTFVYRLFPTPPWTVKRTPLWRPLIYKLSWQTLFLGGSIISSIQSDTSLTYISTNIQECFSDLLTLASTQNRLWPLLRPYSCRRPSD
jgi:hypothetical protein